jgi:predicted transcriptional regulator YdeE
MEWAWKEGRFERLFKNIIFDCTDFLIRKDGKFEFIMAVKDEISESDTAPYKIIDFPGGLYALAVSIDGDHESIDKVEKKILSRLENTNFIYDENRGIMGNMTYNDDEIKKGLGYEQLQRYVPIKLNEVCND